MNIWQLVNTRNGADVNIGFDEPLWIACEVEDARNIEALYPVTFHLLAPSVITPSNVPPSTASTLVDFMLPQGYAALHMFLSTYDFGDDTP